MGTKRESSEHAPGRRGRGSLRTAAWLCAALLLALPETLIAGSTSELLQVGVTVAARARVLQTARARELPQIDVREEDRDRPVRIRREKPAVPGSGPSLVTVDF